jgi:hypothetical protein
VRIKGTVKQEGSASVVVGNYLFVWHMVKSSELFEVAEECAPSLCVVEFPLLPDGSACLSTRPDFQVASGIVIGLN